MKRDVDLSRAILFYIEEHSPPEGGLNNPLEISGYDAQTVDAHAALLIKEGLVEGEVVESIMPRRMTVEIDRLSPTGHEAIEAIRNERIWAKAKKYVSEKGLALTLGVVVEVAKSEVRKHLGLPP